MLKIVTHESEADQEKERQELADDTVSSEMMSDYISNTEDNLEDTDLEDTEEEFDDESEDDESEDDESEDDESEDDESEDDESEDDESEDDESEDDESDEIELVSETEFFMNEDESDNKMKYKPNTIGAVIQLLKRVDPHNKIMFRVNKVPHFLIDIDTTIMADKDKSVTILDLVKGEVPDDED